MPDPSDLSARNRVLVVEDEYLIATELERWLKRAGFEIVGPVPSVEQAINLLHDDGIVAAVLDVNLADGDRVYPVADKLQTLGVPYLFMTGDVRVEDERGYKDRPRLEKPVLEEELVRAVENLITGMSKICRAGQGSVS